MSGLAVLLCLLMRIAQTKIDEVRVASDIVDVVSAHVKLKKRGKNFLGLCPFHQEKTPSFSVSPEKQMYHCFGCGVGGNVFTFVMELEKVSFVEAVRTLAERAGIALPAEGPADLAQATEYEALYEVCRMAGLFFFENLKNTIEGKLALEYFHHRGFTDETIRRFGLGYAMNSWDALIRKAEAEKISQELLDKAGLVVRRDDGSGYYDRFRGRAMFPIFSASGRTIGFGARKLREDDPLGKYINSPETPVYNKSRVLFGLYQAKDAIRDKDCAVLVEGYADLITVWQAGVQNIVASSGTALTEEQIQLVGRYGRNIILVYDADSAGSSATARGVDLIIEGGLDVKVAALPVGEDPDSFVRKHGAGEFRNLLENAVSFLDYKAGLFRSQGLLETPDGQARAVRSIVATLAKMKDELKRNFYLRSISERYGIYETVLYRELESIIGRERGRAQVFNRAGGPATVLQPVATAGGETANVDIPTVERDLLKLIVERGNEMLNVVLSYVDPALLTHPSARQVLQLILVHAERGTDWDASVLTNEIEDVGLKRFVADIVFSKYEISKGWAEIGEEPEEADPWKIAERCITILRKKEVDRQIAENQRRMKEATAAGQDVKPYLEMHHGLMREKKELDSFRLTDRPESQVRSRTDIPAEPDDGSF